MSRALSFSDLDNLGFAAARGRLESCSDMDLEVRELGPFIEYLQLSAMGAVPKPDQVRWLTLGPLTNFYAALRARNQAWVCPATGHTGLFRMGRKINEHDTAWLGFCLAAQKAAKANGFHAKTAAQLAGALGELQSNTFEHSYAPRTGLIAFRARPSNFEFVAADLGIGVLASLRSCLEYASLGDHGKALRLMLTERVSRHGSTSGRGMGFRPLFTGLANLSGSLRFRTGDHALTIDGQNPGAIPEKIAQKVPIKGLFASIACRAG